MEASADAPGRAPSAVLVVDANIILSVVLGRRSAAVFARVAKSCRVITSARTVQEVRGVLRDKVPPIADLAEALLAAIGMIDAAIYAERIDAAERCLALAVASQNGSIADAHLLACAWVFDADIWSHDRDFAGCGWPSWSNANLAAWLPAAERTGEGP